MESGSNITCPKAFADDNSHDPLCPMMMPIMSSHQQQHHHINNNIIMMVMHINYTTNKVVLRPKWLLLSSSLMEMHHQNDIVSSGINNLSCSSVKAKIMAHPHYQRLLVAYVNCQKVGAPPEVAARLEEAYMASAAVAAMGATTGRLGEDQGLDQFMEAYCEMLIKYEKELSKPFKEAMRFLQHLDSQFKTLSLSSPSSFSGYGETTIDRNNNGLYEEEVDINNEFVDPQAEDRELKGQLLRKYSGYLGSLKQEFMKKRKKGKLPKEATQQLLDWWSRHHKWPYPSEQQKLAMAESTGLDQKQINNWFINQRKRHWKPSEDMHFVVMDATHPHNYFMENHPFPFDHITSTML